MDNITKFKEHLASKKSNNTGEKKPSSSTTDDIDELMFDSISNDEQAVQDMLISIFSYWKVLTKRFMDYAALSLRAGCVFDVCPGIRERLRRVPTEQCDFVDVYLAEDAFVRTKRKQLQQTKERLEKVDAILGGHSATATGNDTFTNMMKMENNSLMTLDAFEKTLPSTNINDATNSISINPFSFVTTPSADKTKPK